MVKTDQSNVSATPADHKQMRVTIEKGGGFKTSYQWSVVIFYNTVIKIHQFCENIKSSVW